MRKVRRFIRTVGTAFFTTLLFRVLTKERTSNEKKEIYQIKAGLLSAGISVLIGGCFCYIVFLQKKLEKLTRDS